MRFAALTLVAGLGLIGPARAAEPDAYIFDLLALQPYKANFARLVSAKAAPEWVKAIAAQGTGSAGPSSTIDVGGTPYRLDRVCEVGACAGNTIDVLWAPRGTKVWAALVEDGKAPVMLGDPKGPQRGALEAASGLAATAAAAPGAPTAAPAAPPAKATDVAVSSGAEPDPYIFDILATQPYKGNFARLAKAKATPDWVKAVAVQGAGSAGPMRTVEVDGMPYRLDRVCKVGACATDRIEVLWAPGGAKVWIALVEGGKAPVMLGNPKAPERKALGEAANVGPPR